MKKDKRGSGGFASMDRAKQREIASKGGVAARLEEEAQRRSETSEPGNMGEM